MGGARLPGGRVEARMTEEIPDEPDEPDEQFHRDRREHGGEIDRLDEDRLARLTEEERVEAGVDDSDPDEVPPATDAPPQPDIAQSEVYEEALAENPPEPGDGQLGPPTQPHPPPPSHSPPPLAPAVRPPPLP